MTLTFDRSGCMVTPAVDARRRPPHRLNTRGHARSSNSNCCSSFHDQPARRPSGCPLALAGVGPAAGLL